MSPVERFRAARKDRALAVLEGLHALKHALRFGATILEVRTLDADRLSRLAHELAPDVAAEIAARAEPTEAEVFRRLSPTPPSTGVIALAERPDVDPRSILHGGTGRAVLLERPTHHGNIGAVVRVAAAAGATGLAVTGPHDPWHPAALRGGAGLQFALPVASLGLDLEAAMDTDRPVVALDPEGEPLREVSPLPPRALLAFGSERTGLSRPLLDQADHRVAIPMRKGVSSLNLATAVAIALYGAGGDVAD